jgi:large subunit ribosomal protein L15
MLSQFKAKERKDKKRRGRGNASGLGGEAGRGHKGQKARAGSSIRLWFEGGQTPLYRRLPKLRGTGNKSFKKEIEILDLSKLNDQLINDVVFTWDSLKELGLVSGKVEFKILSNVNFVNKNNVKFTIFGHKISKTALESIEKNNGSYQLIV